MNVTWRNDGSGLGDIEARDDLVMHDCVYRKPVKGAKAGQEKSRKPSIAKDSVASTSTAKILYILGEGEIAGLADGGKSIYLDGTPLLDDAGNSNFKGAYDPAYGYEIGVIMHAGLERMYGKDSVDPNVMFYITVYNEPIIQPKAPENMDVEGITKDIYLLIYRKL